MRRIVDLTQTLQGTMRGVEIEVTKSLAQDGWNALALKLYSHAGTHMDAPRHFLDDGSTIDAVDLARCIGPARVLDLTDLAPGALITVADLARWAEKIATGDRLLFKTGWSARAEQGERRTGFSRISAALAEWLVERGVALIGVEPPSVADVDDLAELTEVHRTLLGGGVVIVEGLTNLDALRSEVVHLIALPLKIAGGDGSPVRAVAIEDGQS